MGAAGGGGGCMGRTAVNLHSPISPPSSPSPSSYTRSHTIARHCTSQSTTLLPSPSSSPFFPHTPGRTQHACITARRTLVSIHSWARRRAAFPGGRQRRLLPRCFVPRMERRRGGIRIPSGEGGGGRGASKVQQTGRPPQPSTHPWMKRMMPRATYGAGRGVRVPRDEGMRQRGGVRQRGREVEARVVWKK